MKNKIVNFAVCVVMLAVGFLAAACTKDAPVDQVYLDAEAKYIAVTKRGVLFNGGDAQINIRSNTYWTAAVPEEAKAWLALSKMGGDGNADIDLSIHENDGEKRSAEVSFRTRDGLMFVVTVSQNAVTDPFFYYKDGFGTGAAMTEIGEYTFEPEGLGVFRGGYSAAGAYVDSSAASEGYEGASGGNNILLKDGDSFVSYGAFNILKDNNFVLSFGSKAEGGEFKTEDLKIYISRSGRENTWAEIPYERAATPGWTYTRVPFFIKEGVLQVYVKVESAAGGYRIDDLSLDEGDESGEMILFPEDIINWVEHIVFLEDFNWLTTDKGTSTMPGADGDRLNTQYAADMHGWICDPVSVYVRPGFPKIGKTNVGGGMITPKLTGLGDDIRDIVVEFDAAQYDADYDAMAVVVKNAGMIAETEEAKKVINIASRNAWAHFTVEVAKATKDTQIQFCAGIPDATQAANSKSNRFWIDNVKIYYKEEIAGPGSVTADVPTVTIPSDGKAQRVVIDATLPWSATPSEAWIVCTPSSGEPGQTEVMISASATSGTSRTASVSFSIGDKSAEVEVAQDPSKLSTPKPEFRTSGNNYLIFEWPRIVDGNTDQKYRFELYETVDGTPVKTVTSQQFNTSYYVPRVAFSNLKPSTKYYLRVKALAKDAKLSLDSDYSGFAEGLTPAARVADPEAFLEMHFDNMAWGGDYMSAAYGYRPEDKVEQAATSLDIETPRVATPGTSVGDYFNTASFTLTFRNDVVGLAGWSGSKIYGQMGYPKFGATTTQGWLQTPPLSAIAGTQDIAVTFRAARYIDYGDNKTPDADNFNIVVTGGGTADQTSVKLGDSFVWNDYTVIITGATATTQVKFIAQAANTSRFLLDDIVIKRASTVKPALTAPVATLTCAEPYYLAFEWPRIAEATTNNYAFELYEGSMGGLPVWSIPSQQFKDAQYDTRVAFPNLKPSTKYYFRVKALTPDKTKLGDSPFSEVVSGTTAAVAVADPAAILELNFDNFRWGSDYIRGAYGYRPATDNEEKAATSFNGVPMTRVANPQTSVSDYFTWTTELRNEAGLEGWTGKTVYGHLGIAKIGGWKAFGWLMTPALEKVAGTKDLTLSFKICCYIDYGAGKTSDDKEMTLSLEGPGTLEKTTFGMENFTWTPYQVVVRGATAETKIKFNSSTKVTGGCRFMLDDVKIVEKK